MTLTQHRTEYSFSRSVCILQTTMHEVLTEMHLDNDILLFFSIVISYQLHMNDGVLQKRLLSFFKYKNFI